MPNLRLSLVLFALVLLPQISRAKDHSAEYATLLSALKAGDTSIDYARLRLSYVDSPEHKKSKDISSQQKAMFAALQNKDFASALKNAEQVLDYEYVDLDAHYVAYAANRELGDSAKAEFHRTIFRGLADSIRNSGDGKTVEKAWVVINVHEEYVLLRLLGYKPSQQSLVQKNGHFYDVMQVKSVDDGSEATFYFNTDIPMREEKF